MGGGGEVVTKLTPLAAAGCYTNHDFSKTNDQNLP